MSGSETISTRACPRGSIHVAGVLSLGVDVFARVIFHVDAGNADALALAFRHDIQVAVLADGRSNCEIW